MHACTLFDSPRHACTVAAAPVRTPPEVDTHARSGNPHAFTSQSSRVQHARSARGLRRSQRYDPSRAWPYTSVFDRPGIDHCSTPTRLERRPPQGGDNAGGVSLRPDYLLRDDTAVDDSTRGSYGHYLGRLTGPGWLMCPPFAPPPLGRFTGPRGHKDAPGSPARHCASYARWFIEVRPNQEHTAVRMPWLFAGGLPRRTGGSTHRPAD